MEAKTRREFLKTVAVGAAAVSVSAGFPTEGQTVEKKKKMVIDMHSHMEVPEAVAMLPEKPKAASSPTSAASAAYQERLLVILQEQLQNPERRIADMDKAGIDLTILSMAPAQMFYNL